MFKNKYQTFAFGHWQVDETITDDVVRDFIFTRLVTSQDDTTLIEVDRWSISIFVFLVVSPESPDTRVVILERVENFNGE